MDVRSAAFHVVYDVPGGTKAVAEFLGKARNTVDHEVSLRESTYKLGLVDAVKVSKRFGDYRILYAFADECGHVCLPAPSCPIEADASTEKVLREASILSRDIAKTFEEMNAALADGQVSPKEFTAFEVECGEAVAAIGAVVRAMRSKMESDQARRHAAIEDARRSIV